VVPEDFSLLKHQRIFARMAELYERGERIDRVTLAEELTKHGQIELVDGVFYLVSLDEGLPNIPNLDSYVGIVKEKALLRKTMFACQDIMNRCALAGEPTSQILETAAGILEQVRSKGAKPSRWCTAREVLLHGLDEVLFPAAAAEHGKVGDRPAAGLYQRLPWHRRRLHFPRNVERGSRAPVGR
jgi:replicative DNA helicase